jgi:hypothetical protein
MSLMVPWMVLESAAMDVKKSSQDAFLGRVIAKEASAFSLSSKDLGETLYSDPNSKAERRLVFASAG